MYLCTVIFIKLLGIGSNARFAMLTNIIVDSNNKYVYTNDLLNTIIRKIHIQTAPIINYLQPNTVGLIQSTVTIRGYYLGKVISYLF